MFEILECDFVDSDGKQCALTNLSRSLFNTGHGNFCAEHFAIDNARRAAAEQVNNAQPA